MSTAFYPTNMRRQSTGGYSNNSSLNNIPYMSWKGTGIHRNPIGMTSTHIRPLTNLDPGNVFQTGFGLPRPIKHYRKGTVLTIDPDSSSGYSHQSLIEYNMNRSVKSSIGTSLGGGNGGTGLISQMIDMPGSFSVKYNEEDTDDMCKTYNGIKVVSGLTPINSLTENPQPNVEKRRFVIIIIKKLYDEFFLPIQLLNIIILRTQLNKIVKPIIINQIMRIYRIAAKIVVPREFINQTINNLLHKEVYQVVPEY